MRAESKTVPIITSELVRRMGTLTPAQLEVARLACLGLSNREVARKRRTSVHTVARQMHGLIEKLGVGSRQVLGVWYWHELARGRWQKLDAIGLTGTGAEANRAMSASLAVTWPMLRPRQRRVLGLLARGYSQGAIAKKLNWPPSTVSSTLLGARKRLGLGSPLRAGDINMAGLLDSVVAAPAKILAARDKWGLPPTEPIIFKSDFIRAQPASLSPLEVLALAKKAGINVTKQLVYAIRPRVRSKRKMAAVKKKRRASSATKRKSAFVRSLPNMTPKEMIARAQARGHRPSPLRATAREQPDAASLAPPSEASDASNGRLRAETDHQPIGRGESAQGGRGRDRARARHRATSCRARSGTFGLEVAIGA